jgi:hypothetical protein
MKNEYNPYGLCPKCECKAPEILRRGIEIGFERVQSKKIADLKLKLEEANRRLGHWVNKTEKVICATYKDAYGHKGKMIDPDYGPVPETWEPNKRKCDKCGSKNGVIGITNQDGSSGYICPIGCPMRRLEKRKKKPKQGGEE